MGGAAAHGPRSADERKTTAGEWRTEVPIEQRAGLWQLTGLDLIRQVLRNQHTIQAGFRAEQVRAGLTKARHPVLFLDGEEHRAQRMRIARFFAPVTVERTYRELMDRYARHTLEELDRTGELDLGKAAMGYSVRVAANIVGLENSDPDAMGRRLMRLFNQPGDPAEVPTSWWRKLVLAARGVKASLPIITFSWRDVRPAVKQRREQRAEDVISHLLDQGYTMPEITTECLTYAAAGMVTTREFIAISAWHLLDRPDLLDRFRRGEQAERYAILHEILRLEPVVGHLYRRAVEDVEITRSDPRTGAETVHRIAAGEMIAMSIKDANVRPEIFDRPRELCPGRELPRGVRPEGLAFGDGAHRCPGHFVAIQETDVFLRHFFTRDVRRLSEPTLGEDTLIAGYRVEGLRVGLR